MTWEEFRERAVKLARVCEDLGQTDLARNWWEGARIAAERIERKRGAQVEPLLLVQELERDEERAVELIAQGLDLEGAARWATARAIYQKS